MEEALRILVTVLSVGSISFGGGWSVVGIIQDRLIAEGWIDAEGFARILALSQLVPGPVALNSATLVGFTQGGPLLALLSGITLVVPAIIMIIVGRWVLAKGILDQASLVKALGGASLALLVFTLYRLTNNPILEWWMLPLAGGAFLLITRTKLPAIVTVLAGIAAGMVLNQAL